MGRPRIGESGRTLASTEGYADLSRSATPVTLRRAASTGLAVGALIAGVAGSSAALLGVADPGVVADDVGGTVLSVSPTGYAWQDGIRPGQQVVSVRPADDPSGWRLETTDGVTRYVSQAAFVEAGLRSSTPVAIGGLFAGATAVLLLRARRSWVLPMACLAFLLLADLRAQAEIEGAERERGKLARELHDVPLQELIAIIRRLEIKPGAHTETDDLRALVGHLRGVATELRPPVLDDLGLKAGLDYLADETSTSRLPVRIQVRDRTTLAPGDRPPRDVELAVFRIASEAVANAVRHAEASEISINGEISADVCRRDDRR
jgi:hypothetical protein